MNAEEVLDYNKKCAEFLGWEKCGTVYRTVEYYNNEKVVGSATHPEHMKFHSDWNLIIEVVEAIEKLDYIERVDIDSTHALIQYKDWYTLVQKQSKKEAVAQAINEFLIWHEQNK